MRWFLVFVQMFFVAMPLCADPLFGVDGEERLSEEDAINMACLTQSYPVIEGFCAADEAIWLVLRTGERVLYATKNPAAMPQGLDVDVKTSMAQPYYCEPVRPMTPKGYAPGRKRPYALFQRLYGANAAQVRKNLVGVRVLGQRWSFSPAAASAFERAAHRFEGQTAMRPWLRNAGTFVWRRIAGESVLSAHSFGIAFDIGVQNGATYWRWCPLRPHPLQQSYPSLLVKTFEDAGFIWGGKWHEYDIMHFEYRPELICKARKMQELSGRGVLQPIVPNCRP